MKNELVHLRENFGSREESEKVKVLQMVAKVLKERVVFPFGRLEKTPGWLFKATTAT